MVFFGLELMILAPGGLNSGDSVVHWWHRIYNPSDNRYEIVNMINVVYGMWVKV